MAPDGSAVYCTLVLTDHYLPGAVVLAHSLRDNGTKAKLVALYTPDTLQHATINELRTIYDEIIPVRTATNHTPANLWLMDRPDLVSTFTKIELWRQTQFTRIVYIDCDVVALRAPDELLTLDADFAAAPDVGWPDCFNSGVMVLRPNMQDYFALRALAERGISFDGADQGLLNMHFRNWERLSFTYNCTPSANYQYIPAYKHFQSTISLIHFIGARKPWNMPRQVTPVESPYDQLLGRWWAIYDRHYRPVATMPAHAVGSQPARPQSNPRVYPQRSVMEPPRVLVSRPSEGQSAVTSYVQGSGFQHDLPQEAHSEPEPPIVSHSSYSYHPPPPQQAPREEAPHGTGSTHRVEISHVQHAQNVQHLHMSPEQHRQSQGEPFHQPAPTPVPDSAPEPLPAPVPIRSAVPQYVRGEEHVSAYIQPHSDQPAFTLQTEQPPHQDTSFQPAPAQSSAFIEVPVHQQPAQTFSEQQEQPPASPPPQEEVDIFEAPKAEWDAAREPPPVNSKPEGIALAMKTYSMSEDQQLFQPPSKYPEAPKNMWYQVPATKPEPAKVTQLFPWERHAPKPTRVFLEDQPSTISTTSVESPSTSSREEYRPSTASWTSWTADEPSAVSWDSYSRSNAWDEVPEIQKYIRSIQQARKGNIQVLSGGPSPGNKPPGGQTPEHGMRGMRVTDYPTEIERPSLPVTPALIRRYSGPASGGDTTDEQLPIAEGVPNQDDWNPLARLEELCRRQSEVLENPDFLLLERERKHG